MDQDDASISIWERVDDGRKPGYELYQGAFYYEPATIKFKQIRHIDSNRKNWQFLASTINECPGVIEFKAYRAVNAANGDFLITVFERYQNTVAQVTAKKLGNGQRWGEALLIKALLELTRAAEALSQAKALNVNWICPERLLVTLEGAVKFHVSIRKSQSKVKYPMYLPRGQSGTLPAPYALGATILYMCLRHIPEDLPQNATWIDCLPRVSEQYPVLVPLLSKYLDVDLNQRYDFSHMLMTLDLPICFTAVRLNTLIQRKEVRRQEAEVFLLLNENRYSGTAVMNATLSSTEAWIECKSCLNVLKVSSVGPVCVCGAVNLYET